MQKATHIGFKLEPDDYVSLGVFAAKQGTSRSALAKAEVVKMIRRKGGNFRKGESI